MFTRFSRDRNFIVFPVRKIAFVRVPRTGIATLNTLAEREVAKNQIQTKDCPAGYKCYCMVRSPYTRVYSSYVRFTQSERKYKNKLEGYEFIPFVKNVLERIDDWHFYSMKYFIDIAPPDVEILRFENFGEEMRKIFGDDIPHKHKNPPAIYWQMYDDESAKIVARLYKWDIDNLGYEF